MQEYINFCIMRILSESLDKDLGEITDEKLIFKDLEGDSFGIADIKMKIWKEFDIPIEFLDKKCNQDLTVGELERIVHSFLNKK